jgi:hypothetical protein
MGASARAFTLDDPPKVDKLDCDTTGLYEEFLGEAGDKFTIYCPPRCTFNEHAVYGVDVYA